MSTRCITLIVLSFAALADSAAVKGKEVQCIKERAHLVDYDIEGEPNDGSSMKGVRRAIISVHPSPAHASVCSKATVGDHTPEGDKEFCYGVNQDSSCQAAKASIPIKDGFDCKDCFVSADADAFYKLNYTMTHLNSVTVGLQNINLRASASAHTLLEGSKTVASGSIPFPGSDKNITLINALVGCPVCVKVKITVGFPTTLEYNVDVSGDADLQAGAALDINLGNNVIHWDKDNKWHHEVDKAQVKVTPLLAATTKATADIKLATKTSFQINLDNIIWYHLNLNPSLDTNVKFEGSSLFHHDQVCINGDAAFDMGQEADLNWNLFTWHAKDHWGPSNLYSWSKSGIINGCKSINIPPVDGSSDLVV